MSIFLRQLYKEPPRIWGSFQDRQYSIWRNLEDIYGVDHKSEVLIMPLFWGLPPLDYSGFNNHGTNHGAAYKDGSLDFISADNDYVLVPNMLDPGNNDCSFVISIKCKTLLLSSIISQQNGTGTGRDIISIEADGTIRTSFQGLAGYSGFTIAINVPTSIALTYNNTTKTIKWYVQGIPGNELDRTVESATGDFIFGLHKGLAAQPLDGTMGNVQFYDYVLSAEQIALFHDRLWDLYRSVSRPVYFLPIYIQKLIEGKYDLLLQKTGEAKYDILAQKITEAKYDILLQKLNEVKYDILLQETIEAKYDILFQKTVESLYDIIVQKVVESKYDIHTQKTAEAIYDILLQTITEAKYDIQIRKIIEGEYDILVQKIIEAFYDIVIEEFVKKLLEAKYDILLILRTIEMQSTIQSIVNLDSEIQTIINFQSTIKPVINLKSYIEE